MTDDTSDGGCDDGPPSFGPGGSDEDPRSLDDLLGAISNHRSRLVLSHLESVSVNAVELDDLVNAIVEHEVEAGMASDSEEHRRHVAIALHHNHLPKLSEVAAIDYDPRSKTVRYWGDVRISACLELFEADDNS